MATTSDIEVARGLAAVDAPSEAARKALSFAVHFCAKRLGGSEDPVALLKTNHSVAHEYLRYGLALRLAEYVADADETVIAVYLHNWGPAAEEVEADAVGMTSPLSLIIWVRRQTAALRSLLADLDGAITREYKALVAPAADRMCSLLDANLVEDREVGTRTGLGALLASTRERPLRVWQRT